MKGGLVRVRRHTRSDPIRRHQRAMLGEVRVRSHIRRIVPVKSVPAHLEGLRVLRRRRL